MQAVLSTRPGLKESRPSQKHEGAEGVTSTESPSRSTTSSTSFLLCSNMPSRATPCSKCSITLVKTRFGCAVRGVCVPRVRGHKQTKGALEQVLLDRTGKPARIARGGVEGPAGVTRLEPRL